MTNIQKSGFTALLILFPVALVLSCLLISASKLLWLDEFYSFYSTKDPVLAHSLEGIATGINASPPVYFILTWLLYKTGIHSIIFYRFLSSLFFLVSFFSLWNYLKQYFNKLVVLAVLIAIFGMTELILVQNSEFRFYSFFFLIEALALIQALKLVNDPGSRKHLFLLFLFIALGSLTHIYGIFYGAAFFAAFVIFSLVQKKIPARIFIAIFLGMAMLLLWSKQLLLQAEMGKPHSWIPVPGIREFINVLLSFVPGGNNPQKLFIALVAASILYFLLYLLKRKGIIKLKPRKEDQPDFASVAPVSKSFFLISGLCLLFVPVIISFIVSRVLTSIFLERYLIPSLLGIILVMIYLLAEASRRYRYSINYLCCLMIAAGFVKLIYFTASFKDDMGEVFAKIAARVPPGDEIIFESPQYFIISQHYYRPGASFYPLDWEVAIEAKNELSVTSNDKIMLAMRKFYSLKGVEESAYLLQPGKKYYVMDEPSKLWLEYHERKGEIEVIGNDIEFPNGTRLKKVLVKSPVSI